MHCRPVALSSTIPPSGYEGALEKTLFAGPNFAAPTAYLAARLPLQTKEARIGIGHVASLARPGGKITGLTNLLTDLVAKELEELKEAVPHARRIGVLWNPTAPSHSTAVKAVEAAGEKLGVELRMRRRSRGYGARGLLVPMSQTAYPVFWNASAARKTVPSSQ